MYWLKQILTGLFALAVAFAIGMWGGSLAAIALLIVAFMLWIVWRLGSVRRGARLRDTRLLATLDPIAARLSRKEPVAPDEIETLARKPEYRPDALRDAKAF